MRVCRVAWMNQCLVLLLIIVINTSCMAGPRYPDKPKVGKVLFDVFYVNFAWGYTLKGFYIDNEGSIYKYDHSHEEWLPEGVNIGVYDEVDLLEKFSHKKEFVGKVPADILSRQVALIEEASRGEIIRKQNGNDMGGTAYTAYLVDPETGKYKAIRLYEYGDMITENKSKAAQSLAKWLQAVSKQIGYNPGPHGI